MNLGPLRGELGIGVTVACRGHVLKISTLCQRHQKHGVYQERRE